MGELDENFEFSYQVKEGDKKVNEGTFSLQNGATKHITNLEAGQTLIITEMTANQNGYDTYPYQEGSTEAKIEGSSYTVEIGEDTQDMTIIFENYRQVTPPTGIHDNVIPFSMMLLTAAAGTVWFGLSGRRKRSA